jgi:hypothetical protein
MSYSNSYVVLDDVKAGQLVSITGTTIGPAISSWEINTIDDNIDDYEDRPTDIKCQYCGQWGKKHSACTFCGAPID